MRESDELTPFERDELAGLARRREPGPALEQRTVTELRARGFLRQNQTFRFSWAAAAAVAAAVALFATGYATGQRSATVAITAFSVRSQQETAMEAALQVQRTGSAYIAALAALTGVRETGDAEAVRQGREAALSALRAAAAEFAVMAPDDPLGAQLLWIFADPAAATGNPETATKTVLWY